MTYIDLKVQLKYKIRMKYRLTAFCWVPKLDTPGKQHKYQFHDIIYDTLQEAISHANKLLTGDIPGEFINVEIRQIR